MFTIDLEFEISYTGVVCCGSPGSAKDWHQFLGTKISSFHSLSYCQLILTELHGVATSLVYFNDTSWRLISHFFCYGILGSVRDNCQENCSFVILQKYTFQILFIFLQISSQTPTIINSFPHFMTTRQVKKSILV